MCTHLFIRCAVFLADSRGYLLFLLSLSHFSIKTKYFFVPTPYLSKKVKFPRTFLPRTLFFPLLVNVDPVCFFRRSD